MTLKSESIAVSTTPIHVTDDVDSAGPYSQDGNPSRSVVVLNKGTNVCYLGGADVTDANGYELAVNASVTLDLMPGDLLYAVCAAAQSATLKVLHLGL